MLIEKKRIPVLEVLVFGLLPSFLKKWAYRMRGYRIGKKVHIGFGSVVCGEQVEIGEQTRIGFLTIIRGKRVWIGPFVQVGSTTFLDVPYIEIGEGSRINEQVFIGGLQYPDSRFIMGKNCQIMQLSFINPAKTIRIGDDTGIGGHSLIFGHTSWLSRFEGYPVEFKDVEIGSGVSLTWRVFLLPGTIVGDGAVIGPNSVVSGTVPPRCLTMGYPSRVVAKAPEFPRTIPPSEREQIFRDILDDMRGYFLLAGYEWSEDGPDRIISKSGQKRWNVRRGTWRFRVAFSPPPRTDLPRHEERLDLFLSLGEIGPEERKSLEDVEVPWIEIAGKKRSWATNDLMEEVSLFLRRYGVRTLRVRDDG